MAMWTLILPAIDVDKSSLSGYVFLLRNNVLSWKALPSTSNRPLNHWGRICCPYKSHQGRSIWLKVLLKDFGIVQKSIQIFCDNQSTVYLSKNNQFHDTTKHIDVITLFVKRLRKEKWKWWKFTHPRMPMTCWPNLLQNRTYNTVGFIQPEMA